MSYITHEVLDIDYFREKVKQLEELAMKLSLEIEVMKKELLLRSPTKTPINEISFELERKQKLRDRAKIEIKQKFDLSDSQTFKVFAIFKMHSLDPHFDRNLFIEHLCEVKQGFNSSDAMQIVIVMFDLEQYVEVCQKYADITPCPAELQRIKESNIPF